MANILNVKEGTNIVPHIIDAIANGYRDDMILDELAQAVESQIITRGQFESAVDALDLYAARFTNSVKSIADAMRKFEFNEDQPILKNRRLDLAEQVVQDVDGFNNAVDEYNETEGEDEVEEQQDVEEEVENKESAVDSKQKPSYQEYFMKKLTEFGVVNPRDLSPEQWDDIDAGWAGAKETD